MLKRAESIDDYSCTLIKRERISGKLSNRQYIHIKIRHRPFSVYLKFLAPNNVKGREAVWVEWKNNGKLLTKDTGFRSLLGTIPLEPKGYVAMQGNLHPITEIGIRNLAHKLIMTTRREAKISDVKVTFRRGAKVGNQTCTCIRFDHSVPRRGLRYRMARIFVDNHLALPIRFEGYAWPKVRGGLPILVEEYTYTNLKLNNGFTDRDFFL